MAFFLVPKYIFYAPKAHTEVQDSKRIVEADISLMFLA